MKEMFVYKMDVLKQVLQYCRKAIRRKPERRKMSEDMSVFKSYLRRLLQDLKDLKEVLKSKDYEKAEKMVDQLIDDTQKGIEDN